MSERPYTLIAELTYRCPLHCPYCSNPVALAGVASPELDTDTWRRVFREAEALGVMQLHLTGGEPLARRDLEELVRAGRECDLYVQLVTSGVPLDRERLETLRDVGLDAVQLSLQDADPESADAVAGYAAHAHKLEVAAWVKACGLPLTINIVLHKGNIERAEAMVDLALRLDADRLELANTQYLGWALPNRAALLPTPEQIAAARAVAMRATERLAGRMEIVFVVPDYATGLPRACMEGWARRYIHVTPEGKILPCHAAEVLPLTFDNVRDRPLASLWSDSPALNRFRGDEWMSDPCKSCERKAIDFGGCRCQAFLLTGDAAATDPACSLSPEHAIVEAARGEAKQTDERRYLFRGVPARR